MQQRGCSLRFCINKIALLLACLLWGAPAWAAIAIDATTDNGTVTNQQNPSYSHTAGSISNGVALVCVTWQDSTPGTLSSVTYGGNAMTALCGAGEGCTNSARQATGANLFTSLWIYKNPSSGSATVQANFSEVINGIILSTRTYSGVDQTTSTGTVASANGSSSPVTVNVSSAVAELVVDCAVGADQTYTVGASQTQRTNTEIAGNQEHLTSDEPGAGTVTMSWAQNSGNWWATIAVPLKPATAAARQSLMLLGVGN